MKLFWAPMSPFVRKVMVVAHETGTAGQIVLEEAHVDMARPHAAVQQANPMSKIPTLVLDDGAAIYDSRPICEYLDSLGNSPLLHPQAPARWDALRRQALGDGMTEILILWRQERLKEPAKRTEAWVAAFAHKIDLALAQLEQEADRLQALPFDIGHVALGCALGYLDLRFADLDWRQENPALAAWYTTFDGRPSAKATRPPPS